MAVALLGFGIALDRRRRVVELELAMKLMQSGRGPVQASPGQDVGESSLGRFRAWARVLRHVAQRASAQDHAGGSGVVAGQDLEQARLARAVATDEADLVA